MLSPLAGAMNRQTSSTPSVDSHPSRRPRWTAKQSAVSSSGPRNWWPHSWAKIHIFTGVETFAIRRGLRIKNPGYAAPKSSSWLSRTVGRWPQDSRRRSNVSWPGGTIFASPPTWATYSSGVGGPSAREAGAPNDIMLTAKTIARAACCVQCRSERCSFIQPMLAIQCEYRR